jgi:DNA invertase Pin-like site-specific DNA recombinase
MTDTVRAIGYGRSSDDKQEASCGQQREWAERKAAAMKLGLTAWHQDEGVPGDVLDRPGLESLFADLARHQKARRPIPTLLVFDQDRLSRATSWATGGLMETLMRHGVERLVTATEEVDLYDDGERAIYGIKQDLNKRGYVKQLSKNVARAMPQYAARGCWNGGPAPYAYRVGGERRDRRLVPGPQEEVAALVELFRLAAEGFLSLWALARVANERGWPVPAASLRRQRPSKAVPAPRWTAGTVHGILRQPAYVGVIRYGRRRVGKYHQATDAGPVERRGPSQEKAPAQSKEGCHEPLVDRATFDRVQAVLTSRQLRQVANPRRGTLATRARRRKKKGTRRPEQFLFRGRLTCACCGGAMQGCNDDGYHGYVCGTWKNKGDCTRNHVHEADLLDRVAELLARELDRPATLDRLRKRLEKNRTGKGETLKLAAEKGRAHVKALAKKVEAGASRLLAVEAHLVPDVQNALSRMKSELEAARADLEQIERQAASSHAEERSVDELLAKLAALPKLLRGADPEKRARVVQLAVAGAEMRFEVTVSPAGRRLTRWTGATVTLRGNGPTYEIDVSCGNATPTASWKSATTSASTARSPTRRPPSTPASPSARRTGWARRRCTPGCASGPAGRRRTGPAGCSSTARTG